VFDGIWKRRPYDYPCKEQRPLEEDRLHHPGGDPWNS
jgi:hypothetical protein